MDIAFHRARVTGLLISLSITVIVVLLYTFPNIPLTTLELQARDLLYNSQIEHGKTSPDNSIVIVAIDDKTLSDPRFGRFQDWKRTYYADLLYRLMLEQPRAIGIDISFSEPSSEHDDAVLAKAIEQNGNVILSARITPDNNVVFPIDTLSTAKGVGFINVATSLDNVVRKIKTRLSFMVGDEQYELESFAEQIVRVYLKDDNAQNPQPYSKTGLYQFTQSDIPSPFYPKTEIPVDEEKQFLINFFGKPNQYSIISFADARDGNFHGISLKDKIVLVGVTPVDMRDTVLVPTSGGKPMSGVELHANAIQTILDRKFLVPPSLWSTLILIIFIGFISGLFFTITRTLYSVLLLLLFPLVYVKGVESLFYQGHVVEIIYPLLAFILVFIAVYLFRFIFINREKRLFARALSGYVNPHIVARISKSPDWLRELRDGQEKEISVFFSDIRGFTTMAESMSAKHLIVTLRRYFEEMTNIIINHGGTVDKYIGDAIMAFWGAPEHQKNYASLACHAAIAQQLSLPQLNINPPLQIGIGIATGTTVIGNIGSEKKFNYTAMGDVVNLASRLEGINKAYGTNIIICEKTYQFVKNEFDIRELDRIQVKGKTKAIHIYELLALQGTSLLGQKMIDTFHKGLQAYRKKEWRSASLHFTKVLKTIPNDNPSSIFLNRIKTLKKKRLPEKWDGIYHMETK